MELFAYGTLMVPEVMSAVSGCDARGEPARLPAYKRRRVAGESYPAIVPCDDEVVDGTLYRNVDDRMCRRLDAFEGGMYCRQSVSVTTATGTCDAYAYVLDAHARALLTDEHWSLEGFAAGHLEAFFGDYEGFLVLR